MLPTVEEGDSKPPGSGPPPGDAKLVAAMTPASAATALPPENAPILTARLSKEPLTAVTTRSTVRDLERE